MRSTRSFAPFSQQVLLGLALASAPGCSGGQNYDDGSDALSKTGAKADAKPDAGLSSAASELDAGEQPSTPELTAEQVVTLPSGISGTNLADEGGGAWRLIEVPALGAAPAIVTTPFGWLALSSRTLGGKAITAKESALYRSNDGVDWRRVPLDPGHDDLLLRDLAFSGDHYVAVGSRGTEGVVWDSADGIRWTEQITGDRQSSWSHVSYAGDLFFAFGFGTLGVSEDGKSWTKLDSDIIQFGSAAYGNGHYVLAGNGPMMLSDDGYSWISHDVDCELPGACISDPSGNVSQSYQSNILFAEGRFFSDQLTSLDGETWEALPGHFAQAYVSGWLLGEAEQQLSAWTPSEAPRPVHVVRPAQVASTSAGREIGRTGVLDSGAAAPASVSVPFEDALTCEDATCIIVGSRLYLVPAVDTEPLTDRVPRRADGKSLLSDECPVSSMITCEDYELREGCSCDLEAPRSPAWCADVSNYQCAGAFTHTGEEWELDEVAQAGCDCQGSDPNQPPSLGLLCQDDAALCKAPLTCLETDTPPSQGGPPSPAPLICTSACAVDSDCPSWSAKGFCGGDVQLLCSNGSCQPRSCE